MPLSSSPFLSKISDSRLSTELAAVEANYTYLKNSYLNANIVNYTSIMAGELSRLNSEYTLQDSIYNHITNLAANNTGVLRLCEEYYRSSIMHKRIQACP